VALSGDGADEIFAGYNKYLGEFKARENGLAARLVKQAMPLWESLPMNRNSFLGNKVRQLHRFASSMNFSPQERYWYLTAWRDELDAQAILRPAIREQIDRQDYQQRKETILSRIKGKDFNEILYSDTLLVLPNDMLHKVDSMSMAHALEVRVPFMDHRVVNFAFGLPAHYKINGKMKKRILQDAVRHLLPKELYNRPKHGFDVPLAKGYKRELRSWIEPLLDDAFVESQQVFDVAYTQQLKKTIFETNNFDQNQVWAVLAFQHWWKKYIG
jgi:asparagine synthase (glutamine-hydrolysing)